jgi:hypothetical protein
VHLFEPPRAAQASEEHTMTHAALLAAILSIASPDRVDADAFASAVESAAKGDADWAALLITIAAHESNLSARIATGSCRPWECDSAMVRGERKFRAWGLFQEHENLNNLSYWGSTDLSVQTQSASRLLKRAYWSCKRVSSSPWLTFTINAYAGKRCDAEWVGLDARMATFRRLRRAL